MSAVEDEVVASPTVRIGRGTPTDEELAAVVAVLMGLAAAHVKRPLAPEIGTVSGGWKNYWRAVRQPLLPGREPWRSTLRA